MIHNSLTCFAGGSRAATDQRTGYPSPIKNSTLEPDEISSEAYEQALHTLSVKDRDDPLTETIAKQIIKIAQAGVHDAAQLSALAIAALLIR
jgi:hypothetical protein